MPHLARQYPDAGAREIRAETVHRCVGERPGQVPPARRLGRGRPGAAQANTAPAATSTRIRRARLTGTSIFDIAPAVQHVSPVRARARPFPARGLGAAACALARGEAGPEALRVAERLAALRARDDLDGVRELGWLAERQRLRDTLAGRLARVPRPIISVTLSSLMPLARTDANLHAAGARAWVERGRPVTVRRPASASAASATGGFVVLGTGGDVDVSPCVSAIRGSTVSVSVRFALSPRASTTVTVVSTVPAAPRCARSSGAE